MLRVQICGQIRDFEISQFPAPRLDYNFPDFQFPSIIHRNPVEFFYLVIFHFIITFLNTFSSSSIEFAFIDPV